MDLSDREKKAKKKAADEAEMKSPDPKSSESNEASPRWPCPASSTTSQTAAAADSGPAAAAKMKKRHGLVDKPLNEKKINLEELEDFEDVTMDLKIEATNKLEEEAPKVEFFQVFAHLPFKVFVIHQLEAKASKYIET